MTFFAPDSIQAATGGDWLARPARSVALRGVGIDSREDLDRRAFVALRGPNHDGHDFLRAAASAGASLLIVERGPEAGAVPAGIGILRVASTRRALADLARAWRRELDHARVIAITGSAGKTTTKTLLEAILSRSMRGTTALRSFNNDIGVPLTILAAARDDEYVILEIGMNAPGEIATLAAIAAPDVVVITSLGRAHLEGLGSLEAVAREKASILDSVAPGGLAVVNADAPLLRRWCRGPGRIVLFGAAPDATLRLTARQGSPGGHWFEVDGHERFELGLPGRHNALNALAAIAVARGLGVPERAIREGLAAATPPPMRMTPCDVAGVRVFNDAYNANPEAVAAALATFGELASDRRRRVVILGDMLELGEGELALHREVGAMIAAQSRRTPIDHVVLIGSRAAHIEEGLGAGWSGRVTAFAQMPTRPRDLADLLAPGDAVLLKGSRGAGLEQVIELLAAAGPTPRETATTAATR